jgi:hypothetical protein
LVLGELQKKAGCHHNPLLLLLNAIHFAGAADSSVNLFIFVCAFCQELNRMPVVFNQKKKIREAAISFWDRRSLRPEHFPLSLRLYDLVFFMVEERGDCGNGGFGVDTLGVAADAVLALIFRYST